MGARRQGMCCPWRWIKRMRHLLFSNISLCGTILMRGFDRSSQYLHKKGEVKFKDRRYIRYSSPQLGLKITGALMYPGVRTALGRQWQWRFAAPMEHISAWISANTFFGRRHCGRDVVTRIHFYSISVFLPGCCWSQVVWHFLPLLIPIGYFLYVHCHIIRWPHLSSSLSRYRLAAPAPGLRPCIDYDGETSKVSSAREFKIVLPILHLINLPSPSNGASSWAKSGQTWILQTTIVTNTQYILV